MLTFVLTLSTAESLHGNGDKVAPDMPDVNDSTPTSNNLDLNITQEDFIVGE